MDYNARKITRHLQQQYATALEQPLSWEIIDAFCALQEVGQKSNAKEHLQQGDGRDNPPVPSPGSGDQQGSEAGT